MQWKYKLKAQTLMQSSHPKLQIPSFHFAQTQSKVRSGVRNTPEAGVRAGTRPGSFQHSSSAFQFSLLGPHPEPVSQVSHTKTNSTMIYSSYDVWRGSWEESKTVVLATPL